MKIIDKLNEPKYRFIIQNLTIDTQLADDHKQQFVDYVNNTEIEPDLKDEIFERKVNEEFFFLNISPQIAIGHNKVGSLISNKLTRVMSKSKLYNCLKQGAGVKFQLMYNSEEDFIDSLELGTGKLVERFGYKILKRELSGFEFGYKMMWSNYAGKGDGGYIEKSKLTCILGLDNKTILNSKYLIQHEYSGDKYYPTTFDAGFNDLWEPGGKTRPRKLHKKFRCDETVCETCLGLNEIVHRPNTIKNIVDIEILD